MIVNMNLSKIAGSINLMPLNGVRICYHQSGDEKLIYIHQLEEESSYKITPVTRKDGYGNLITLGYNVEAIVYVSHNNYKDNKMLEKLEELTTLPYSDGYWHLILMIGDSYRLSNPDIKPINTIQGKGFWIELLSPRFTWELESVQLRPRLILRTNQFIKTIKSVIV